MESKSLWEILVPRRYNSGRPVTTRHHKNWDEKVRRITSGVTIFPPTTKGEWVGPDGKIYVDSTIPVRLVCSRHDIERIMDLTAKHYKQLAVMAYRISDEVIIRDYE